MPSWDDVVEIGTRFPDVEVSTSYGTPALKVRKKLLCRMRTDPDALALRVIDMGEREALLQGQPEVFFGSDGTGLSDLERVKVPVTVLWGEKDRVLPERLHGPFFRRELPHANYRTMPNAGHVPFWEATDTVVDGVRETAKMAGAGFEPA